MDPCPLKTVTTSPDQLDPQSVAYLRAIAANSGARHPGILAWQPGQWFAGPRGGGWCFLFLGLALLGLLVYVCWEIAPQYGSTRELPYLQAIIAGLGTLFLLVGIVRFLRPKPRWLPRFFLFADASYLWEVTPKRITATPLSNLKDVDGTHHSSDGSYTQSVIQLKFPEGIRKWTLHNKAVTENLLSFLQYLIVFRSSEHENLREWATESPGRLGAAAARFVACGPDAGLGNLPETANPPDPYTVPADPSTPNYSWGGTVLCFLGATAVGIACIYAFPILDHYLHDEYLFAQIPERDNGQLKEIARYLEAFPDGRHAPMVRELFDDRRFAEAQRDAEHSRSPRSLRAYLVDNFVYISTFPGSAYPFPVDKSIQRHRTAAQRLIADCYDQVIEDLKKKQGREPDKIDKDLFEGILALLEGLKRADHPVVTVGFKATLQQEPETREQKEREKSSYDRYLKQHPELKDIAERSPSRSAIITSEQVFDKGQTTRREEVILERLLAAVRQGINADILTLKSSAPGESPMMEVSYHILADGDLGTYKNTEKRLVGLLRWYAIRWIITIRPPGPGKSFVYRLRSEPGSKLTYDSDPGDPSWAIYAVVLYSGFYDMSARLIRNFGLDPGPAPNAFSFAATARHEPHAPDKPLPPDVPFPNKGSK